MTTRDRDTKPKVAAFAAGRNAFQADQREDTNPHPSGGDLHARWQAGWRSAQASERRAAASRGMHSLGVGISPPDAFASGRRAWEEQKTSENPYRRGTMAHAEWRAGWDGAQRKSLRTGDDA